MRILIWSAPPWARTGYGVGARHLARLLGEKHQVAISPMTRVPVDMEWEGIAVMANKDADIGMSGVVDSFRRFEAEVIIQWFEAWLLGEFLPRASLSHAAIIYSAVDHQPLSPRVRRAVQGVLSVVPYCRFAQRVYDEAGVDCVEPIYHGVDTSVFRPADERKELRKALELPEDAFVFGINAANTGPRKNIPNMMRAFHQFLRRNPRARKDCYLLVHTYPVPDENFPDAYHLYQVWEALGGPVENFCCTTPERYLEGLSDEGMARWYNAIDVLLNCSMGEGFGLPILEAAACGVPSIATRFSSMEELVEGRGWLVEVADMVPMQHISSWMAVPSTEGMVRVMAEGYGDRGKVRKLGQRAYEFARTNEWGAVGRRWLELLDSLGQVKRDERPLNMEFLNHWRLGLIPEQLPEGVPPRVLDVGCGHTKPYKPYLEKLGEYVSLDLRGGNGVIPGDMRNLPFKDKEFGFVWASEVLEHVDEGHDRAVAEARRVGHHGAIIFPTPDAPGFDYDPSHREVKDVEYIRIASGYGLITW
jgi:glycosyltransferase involved in cell wall biosynthesis